VWREDSDSVVKLVRSVRWRWYGNGDERDALVVCEEEKVKCDLSSALGDSQGIMRPCGGTHGRGGKQQRDQNGGQHDVGFGLRGGASRQCAVGKRCLAHCAIFSQVGLGLGQAGWL
jgi:hypothetical protein